MSDLNNFWYRMMTDGEGDKNAETETENEPDNYLWLRKMVAISSHFPPAFTNFIIGCFYKWFEIAMW